MFDFLFTNFESWNKKIEKKKKHFISTLKTKQEMNDVTFHPISKFYTFISLKRSFYKYDSEQRKKLI